MALIAAEEKRKRRFDWHGVTFWSCLVIAVYFLVLSRTTPDHKVPTIFEARGRDLLRSGLRNYYPEIAKKLGVVR